VMSFLCALRPNPNGRHMVSWKTAMVLTRSEIRHAAYRGIYYKYHKLDELRISRVQQPEYFRKTGTAQGDSANPQGAL
jgi:hypothetical protein